MVSDGTAVLGLGDIGPSASLPVMEGKSALFKAFGGLDSIPLVLDTTDVDEIVETLVRLRPSFGAVNLEDVSAPRCFELEAKLIEALDCPVMHDDQHGTAIVAPRRAARGLCRRGTRPGRGLRVRGLRRRSGRDRRARGSCSPPGSRDVVLLDSRGVLVRGRAGVDRRKKAAARRRAATRAASPAAPAEALPAPTCSSGSPCAQLAEEQLALMAPGGDRVRPVQPGSRRSSRTSRRATRRSSPPGRSDFPNQINNVLAFPGVFRGALDAGRPPDHRGHEARRGPGDLRRGRGRPGADQIVPSPLDPRVAPAVSAAVAAAAGVTR